MGPIEGIFRELKERILKYGWTPYSMTYASCSDTLCGCVLNHIGRCHGYQGDDRVGNQALGLLYRAADVSNKSELAYWNDQQTSVESILAAVDIAIEYAIKTESLQE